MKHTNNPNLTGTYFTSCTLMDNAQLMQIQEFIFKIKSDMYKPTIVTYRKLLKEGKDDEAARIKRSLPVFLPSAQCLHGRKEGDEDALTRMGMSDYDLHDFELAAEVCKKSLEIPWIIACYITPSGGVRHFFLLPEFTMDSFRFIENVVFHVLDPIVGFKHDPQAVNPLRLSFASYDPNAWCRPEEECTVEFPFEEELCKIQRNIDMEMHTFNDNSSNVRKNGYMDTSHTCRGLNQLEADELNFSAAYYEETGEERQPFTQEHLDNILYRFASKHPFVKGMRNKHYMALGRYACFVGVSPKELGYIIRKAEAEFGDSEYNLRTISTPVIWGYQHGDRPKFCKTNVSSDGAPYSKLADGRKSTKSTKSTSLLYTPFQNCILSKHPEF